MSKIKPGDALHRNMLIEMDTYERKSRANSLHDTNTQKVSSTHKMIYPDTGFLTQPKESNDAT